jgi:phosphotriesterase-related protein
MSIVRTVLGDVPPSALGRTYAHEHLVIDESYATQVDPKIRLESVDAAVKELQDLKAAGAGTVVDCMPCDAGRNVLKLAEISRRSGVHVVAPTGLHRKRFYPPGHWRVRVGVEGLTELFVREIEEGIDANDCAGPEVRRTPHRAGVLKAASDGVDLDDAERVCFEAVAAAHRRTGAPVITHCEPARGLEQIRFLGSRGVAPGHLVLSHTDRHPDPDYHRELLRTGVFLEYDRVFRAPLDEQNPTLRLFSAMVKEFPDQLMLGTDAAKPAYWRHYAGGPGLDYLLKGFGDLARKRGLTDADFDRVFVANPARAYAFAR